MVRTIFFLQILENLVKLHRKLQKKLFAEKTYFEESMLLFVELHGLPLLATLAVHRSDEEQSNNIVSVHSSCDYTKEGSLALNNIRPAVSDVSNFYNVINHNYDEGKDVMFLSQSCFSYLSTLYKRVALRTHPDKHGGSTEAFCLAKTLVNEHKLLALLSLAMDYNVPIETDLLTISDYHSLLEENNILRQQITNIQECPLCKWRRKNLGMS